MHPQLPIVSDLLDLKIRWVAIMAGIALVALLPHSDFLSIRLAGAVNRPVLVRLC
jgi:hypothetical protein